MSRFADSYASPGSKNARESEAYLALLDEVPAVADVLAGTLDADGRCVVPPCTVQIFLDAGVLKFCLSPKVGDRVAFGVVQEPLYSLQGIERALEQGKFEWKTPKGRR
jgi:hypothetical protein